MPLSKLQMDNIKGAIDQMNLEQLMELRIKVQADIEQTMRDLYVTRQPQNDYEQAMGEIPPDMPGLKNWAAQQGMSASAAATVFGNTHPEATQIPEGQIDLTIVQDDPEGEMLRFHKGRVIPEDQQKFIVAMERAAENRRKKEKFANVCERDDIQGA